MEEKYTTVHYISGGASGRVFSVRNARNEKFARKTVELLYLKRDQYKRLYHEICILKQVDSRYCLRLIDIYGAFGDHDQLKSLILPMVDFNLKDVNEFRLTYRQIIQIMYQLLMGLKYLFDCGIIHRDLKPANIGISENLDLKILDFGLARELHVELTDYVVTRWYRPLEVFYTTQYTIAVDMWSAGCIFAELFTKKVLFRGSGRTDQVIRILAVMGWPSDEMLNKIKDQKDISGLESFKSDAAPSNQLANHIRKEIETFVSSDDGRDSHCANDVFTLISRMLELDPDTRITPSEALGSFLFKRHRSFIASYKESGTTRQFTCLKSPGNADTIFWINAIKKEISDFYSQ